MPFIKSAPVDEEKEDLRNFKTLPCFNAAVHTKKSRLQLSWKL